MPAYIADCRGYSTGQYDAENDAEAWRYAQDWARDTWTFGGHSTIQGIVEVWHIGSDTLVRSEYLSTVLGQ